jgi:cytochrome c2
MRDLLVATFSVLLIGITAAQAQVAGDPAAGEQVFRKCQACHSLQAGAHTVGPPLQGVIGRTAGSVPGYPYSVAMRRSGIYWSPDTLDKFLTSPSHLVHGTKMIFTGLRDPKDRADVIAYIEQQMTKAATAAPATAPAQQPSTTASSAQTTATATATAQPQTQAAAQNATVAPAASQKQTPPGYATTVR